jgi:hypothetical protein
MAKRVCGVEGRADLPSPPEQSKLSRDVGTAARKLKDEIDIFQTHLKRVLTWVKVPPNTSKRAETVAKLGDFLGALLVTTAHADRMRALAALDGDAQVEPYAVLRRHLADEQRALQTIEGQKRAFEQVGEHGTEAERKAVAIALQNILREPVAEHRRLASVAGDWVGEADRIFGELLKRGRSQVGGTGDGGGHGSEGTQGSGAGGHATGGGTPGGDATGASGSESVVSPQKGVTKRRSGIAKRALHDEVLAALREALDGLEGDRFDVDLTLQPTRDPKDGSGS